MPLANNPKFLLLDEPFAGVDPIAVEDIQSIISVLKEKISEFLLLIIMYKKLLL